MDSSKIPCGVTRHSCSPAGRWQCQNAESGSVGSGSGRVANRESAISCGSESVTSTPCSARNPSRPRRMPSSRPSRRTFLMSSFIFIIAIIILGILYCRSSYVTPLSAFRSASASAFRSASAIRRPNLSPSLKAFFNIHMPIGLPIHPQIHAQPYLTIFSSRYITAPYITAPKGAICPALTKCAYWLHHCDESPVAMRSVHVTITVPIGTVGR